MSKRNPSHQEILDTLERCEEALLKFAAVLIEFKHSAAIMEAVNKAQAEQSPLHLEQAQSLYSANDTDELVWCYRRNVHGHVIGKNYYAFTPRAVNCLELADLGPCDNWQSVGVLDDALNEEARLHRYLVGQAIGRTFHDSGCGDDFYA